MSNSTASADHALVYLFGAGASFPSLPLARGVSQGMIDWGRKSHAHADTLSEGDLKKSVADMSEELLSWGTRSASHYSIDTLAKKLFLTNKHDDLCKLKAAMSAFFLLQQSATPVEQRYDSFLAAILEQPGHPPALPEHIWLLTWNYDRQFERAYHQYWADSEMVQDNITFCKRVVRLNGLLGRAIEKGTGDEYNLKLKDDESGVFARVAGEYWQLREREPQITFAFEKPDRLDAKLQGLSGKKCTLVVVGYSFPFFNRRFDKLVMDSIANVSEVYLQVLPEDAKAIESRMRSLRELPSIEIIDDREQFYVPYLPS